ncbi:alpha/beta hydrolase [Orrella sp. JC864]|uniref:alpha/beta hydrolase n=1 Tax=Orrella sp. JC864 TaxID=3120298 RepID=UPI00300BA160
MSIMDTVKSAMGLNPIHHADLDMQRVLDALDGLDPKPLHRLTPEEARRQPTPADAVRHLMRQENIAPPADTLQVEDIAIADAAGGANPARVYRPAGQGPLPVILYFHGGGWVIADLDTYDATPRALAMQTGAIVVSAHYRQAPEHKFPAAHEDACAAYAWLLQNAAGLGADPARIALAGESAGANLAINVAIHARDQGLQAPLYQVLVYPLANMDTDTESYHDSSNARPLGKEAMLWFLEHATATDQDRQSPLLRVLDARLQGLPAATVITAGIDPLRTEGEQLAHALTEAGVPVTHKGFAGVTHEFFGMAPVLEAARQAQALVCEHLRRALQGTGGAAGPADGAAPVPPNETGKAPPM